MRHPKGLDFANERKIYHLRKDKHMSWEAIAEEVVNNSGNPSTADTVRRAFLRFRAKFGASKYNYANCGRRRTTMTLDVQKFIIRKLLQIRKKNVCTSTTLQALVAK